MINININIMKAKIFTSLLVLLYSMTFGQDFILSPTNIPDVGETAAPTICDLDNDGLLDILIGKGDGTISHYEQDFYFPTDFLTVSTNFNSIDVGSSTSASAAPTVTDLDNDGLLDLIVGESTGNLNHYEQVALNSLNFSLVTENFNSIDVGNQSAPYFLDIDNDGLLDLFIGEYSGNINHYEQTTSNGSDFALITETFNSLTVGTRTGICIKDFNNNGLLDLIIGENNPNINYYEQSAANSNTYNLISDDFLDINYSRNKIDIADINDDGLEDMIIGDNDGNVYIYLQVFPVEANFSVSVTSSFIGEEIVFTDLSLGTQTAWLWNFGDGVSSILQNPTHIYQSSGTYTIELIIYRDNESDTLSLEDYLTIEIPPIELTYISADESCPTYNDGNIDITVSGGLSPYTFLWSSGETLEDLYNVAAGSYYVTVTDYNSSFVVENIVISQPELNYQVTIPNCYNSGEGIIELLPSGGTSPYTYNWSTNESTQNIDNLMAGTYYVSVYDYDQCLLNPSNEGIIVNQPTVIQLSFTHEEIDCYGNSNGSIDLTVQGGTSPYSFQWSNGESSEDISGLSPDTFYVTVVDDNSCSADNSEPTTFTLPWNYSTNESNHTIGITNPNIVFIDGNPLDVGDFVGVFYDSSGTKACAGYEEWNGQGIGLAAWGAEAGIDNGFMAGEEFSFKVWRAINGEEIDCDATYNTVSVPNTAFYTPNGISVIETLIGNSTGELEINGIVINQPDELIAQTTGTEVICYGINNGYITLSTVGGGEPYEFLWSDGSTTQNIVNLAGGLYDVTVTDTNNCTIVDGFGIEQLDEIIITYVKTDITCTGFDDGTIDISVTGGSADYTYLWSTGASTQDISNLQPGTYLVTVTDNINCIAIEEIEIFQPSLLVVGSENTNVSCFGFNDGVIELTPSGGTSPFTYIWSNQETTQNIADLYAGQYEFTVTDMNQCTYFGNEVITEPNELTILVSGSDTICFETNEGFIDLTISGGTEPYQILWSNNETSEDINQLSGGLFSVTVTDFNNCIVQSDFTVLELDEIIIYAEKENVSCFGLNNGMIDLTVIGGTGNYFYNWSSGSYNEDLFNLPPGDYDLFVTDNLNCEAEEEFEITEPELFELEYEKTDIACFDDGNGSIDLTVSGGTTPYTFNWANFESTEDLSGLSGGVYNVTVLDDNNCSVFESITIAEPNELSLELISTTDVLCFEQSTGEIEIETTGGISPYDFDWSNGEDTEDLINLLAGAYELTVTDQNNCTEIISATITEPSTAIMLQLNYQANICYGTNSGEISAIAIGGTVSGDYNYLWSNGGTTDQISGLIADSYQISVSDDNGCEKVEQAEIIQPSDTLEIINSTANDVNCFGENTGSIDITVSGGWGSYSYSWNNSATTEDISDLITENYSVTVTDMGGCEALGSYFVDEPTNIELELISTTDILCFNQNTGEIDIEVTGGSPSYSFLWSNNATTEDLSDITADSYQLTVTDLNGCTETISATITSPDKIVVSGNEQNPTCNGNSDGSITLTITGGVTPYQFVWSNTATTQNIDNLDAGNYSVTITDDNNCTKIRNYNLSQPSIFTVFSNVQDVSCYGFADGSINVTILGGSQPYTFLWSNGATTEDADNLVTETYTLTITDANNCIKNVTKTVEQPDELIIALDGSDTICYASNNGFVNSLVSGGEPSYNYLWSNGASTQNINNLSGGTYIVSVSDDNSCETIDEFFILELPEITIAEQITNTTCFENNDGAIDISVAGGIGNHSYLWSNLETSEDIDNLYLGNYSIAVVDEFGCEENENFTVSGPEFLEITFVENSVSCFGYSDGSIDISVSGGTAPYSYTWDNSETSEDLNTIPQGTYSITVTDLNNCVATEQITLGEPIGFDLIVNKNDILCLGQNDGSIEVIPNGGDPPFSFIWSNNETDSFISNLAPGTYYLTIEDVFGCIVNENFEIFSPTMLQTTMYKTNVSVFGGNDGTATVVASGGVSPYSYAWSDAAGQTNQIAIDLIAGTYYVTVSDANLCEKINSVTITQPLCNADYSYSILGDSITMQNLASGSDLEFLWDFDDFSFSTEENPVHYYLQGGFFNVCLSIFDTITGCQDSYCEIIEIQDTNIVTCNSDFNYSAIDTTVTFTNNSSGTLTDYFWEFGDGSVSYLENPVHHYDHGDFYNVCLTTYDALSGCQSISCQVVYVEDPIVITCNSDFGYFPVDTTVSFNNLAQGYFTNFYWNFGDGNFSNSENPVHHYQNGGFFEACLTIFDSISGCTDNYCEMIFVEELIVVTCNSDFIYFPIDTTVFFENNSLGTYTDFFWSFGDGFYSYEEEPVHQYDHGDYYNVCLTIFDTVSGCQDIFCDIIYVEDPVVVVCNADFEYFPVDTTVSFTSISTGTFTNFSWSFGDGTYSTSENPVHHYENGDYYEVCLTVYDLLSGCQNTYCEVIYVEDPVVVSCNADFEYFPDDTTVVFANISYGTYTNYHWSFGDGFYSSQFSPVHNYDHGDYYEVCLTVYDTVSGCQDMYCTIIYVVDPVVVSCNSNFEHFAIDTSVTFANLSFGTFTNFLWNFGDGTQSTLENPVHQYENGGFYNVCLTIFDTISGCQDIFCKNILVEDPIIVSCNANFEFFPVDTTVSFSNISTGSFTDFLWSFGDGYFSYEENPVHHYEDGDYYVVTLTILDSISGCQDIYSTNIIVEDPVIVTCNADFEFFPVNTTVTFSNESFGTYTDFFWDFGDGQYSNVENPVNIYATGGFYDVCLTVFDSVSGCQDNYCQNILVEDPIVVSCNADFIFFSEDTTVTFLNLSLGTFTNFFWDFDDGQFSSLEHPVHNFSDAGYYYVCLTVYDSVSQCQNTFCQDVVVVDPVVIICNAEFTYVPNDKTIYFTQDAVGSYSGIFWDFDDGYNSNQENPVHIYEEDGYYEVCLCVLDTSTGCFDTYCDIITVGDPTSSCKADFTYFPDINDSLTIHFADESFGDPDSWYWDFDDNSFANISQNPVYTFANSGYFRVSLTIQTSFDCSEFFPPLPPIVCDSLSQILFGCQKTYSKIIAVGDVSNSSYAFYTYFADSITATAHFNNESEGEFDENSWFWEFGDGITSYQENPSHTYADTGYYAVCLTTTTINGLVKTYCNEVRIGNSIANPCLISCVWPGDANNDLEANNYDILKIGLNYGLAGPNRAEISTYWTGHFAQNWSTYQLDGTNNKHGDCNGDGVINLLDIEAIYQNFAHSHYQQPDKNDAVWFMNIGWEDDGSKTSRHKGRVRLRRATKDLGKPTYDNNLYGLGYEIELLGAEGIIWNSIEVSFDTCWLGNITTDLMSFFTIDSAQQKLFIGLTKFNQQNASGGENDTTGIMQFSMEFLAGYDTSNVSFIVTSAGGVQADGSHVDIASEANIASWQIIPLDQGWSMFSTFLTPNALNIGDLMQAVSTNVMLIKDDLGMVYWPSQGINLIGDINIGKGYQVNMLNADSLTIVGPAVDPLETPVPIPSGYSMIGYLRIDEASIIDVFSDIAPNTVIVKDDKGYVYWPYFGFNNIGNMEPGKGYSVKMGNADTLIFPANGQINKATVQIPQNQHYIDIHNTGVNMTLGLPKSSFEDIEPFVKIGDEIGIFNESDELVGASVYTGGYAAISIWGDDEYSDEIDGILDNEKFAIKVWNEQYEYTLTVENWIEGDEFYETNKISIAGKLGLLQDANQLAIILLQNVPNPFADKTQISFYIPEDTYLEINTYNVLGEKIEQIVGREYTKGLHTVVLDANDYAPGTYFYKLITPNFIGAKSMNVIK